MPKIQEYLPEQSAEGPRGGTSPNLEAVTELGAGVEKFGAEIQKTGDILESRSAMMEAADAQANVSDQKAEFYNRIQDETKRGVLDQNKLFDDYDSWASDQASQYDTPRGRAEFERSAARTRGAITRWAVAGKAQIDGANAVADHTNTFNNLSNLTQQNPESWADNHAQLLEMYNGYENDPNMNKNPAALQAMKSREEAQLAGDAVKGLQARDFNNIVADMVANGGKVDPRDPRYNQAQGMLDHVDPDTKKGVFDDFITADKKAELTRENRANFTAAQTEGNRVLALQQVQKDTAISDWQAQAIGKMAAGKLTAQEIVSQGQKLGMSYESQISMIKNNYELTKLAADKKIKTPPEVYNEVTEKIMNGEIDSHEQIMQYASKGLVGNDMRNFTKLLDKTPEGQNNLQNEKRLMDIAKSTLVSGNAFLGKTDPLGQQKLALFAKDLQQAKQDAATSGAKVAPLLDPTSKEYFGNKLNGYRLTPQEQLDASMAKYSMQPSPTVAKTPTAPAAGKIYVYDAKGNRMQTTQRWLDANPNSGFRTTK